LQPRAVRPAPLLREMGRMLTRTLGEAVTVHIQCAAEVPPVYADPAELETALVNLAVNARDAMPRGGRLTIAAEGTAIDVAEHDRSIAPGRYVAFKVADTGSGMSPDVRARAVEPFFTTKGAGKGSGLGLSMVYGFVTQSGGCVDVDSQLGYGTRVTFLLPVARDAAPMPREHVASAAPARSATVLVVEDEAKVRNIAAAFLRDLGYEVLTAAGALSALQELASQPHVDLLFTDVVLGDTMSGVELAHEARRLYPGLAVLLVSGYSGVDSDPRHVDTAAQFPLLRKPYRREQLADAVRAVLHDS
jgi:CheY-like chemotaxis protein